MFHPSALPRIPGELLVISDRLASPAEFILHAVLASHIKESNRAKCVLVSFEEAFGHWKNVAARLTPSTNLSSQVTNGRLYFIDGLSDLIDSSNATDASVWQAAAAQQRLVELYERILLNMKAMPRQESGVEHAEPGLLIIDNLSALEWLGIPIIHLRRFLRALLVLCRKHGVALVVRHHRLPAIDVDELLRSLLQACSYYVEVLPLASGRSAAVSGEIALHQGPSAPDKHGLVTFRRSKAMQYCLTEAGAVYFERGTAASVL